jgi:hypothetical protein
MAIRIPLEFGTNGLIVTGLIYNQQISPKPINFLIDTGAGVTAISPSDQFTMGVDPAHMGLPRYKKRIITAGGKTTAYELQDSLICLVDEEDKPVSLEADIILLMERLRQVGKSKKDKEAKQINEMQPSIIGRDLLEKHGLILHSDFGTKTAYLELA